MLGLKILKKNDCTVSFKNSFLIVYIENFNTDCLNIFFSTKRITITNFCLGKHLIRDNDLLKDQRGSPAYISPDVLSGE